MVTWRDIIKALSEVSDALTNTERRMEKSRKVIEEIESNSMALKSWEIIKKLTKKEEIHIQTPYISLRFFFDDTSIPTFVIEDRDVGKMIELLGEHDLLHAKEEQKIALFKKELAAKIVVHLDDLFAKNRELSKNYEITDFLERKNYIYSIVLEKLEEALKKEFESINI